MAERDAKRILVIDDDPRYIDLIRLRLEHAGYRVLLAFDGHTGLERAREEPRPDLVLSDILLPKTDGFEICHTLKSDPETAALPVILMSAIYLASEDKERGLRTGANRYLVKPDALLDKPLRFEELLGQVRFLLGDTSVVPRDWENHTVLVVDDDPRNLRLLELTLKSESYQVLEAPDARTALRRLEERSVDLVLTDIQMPGMTGLELLREIRRRHPKVTVVMMTAYGSEQVAVEAMKLGANDYLTKPINTRELGLRLSENLERHRLRIDRERLLHKLKDTSRDLMTRVEALEKQNRALEESGREIQRVNRTQAEFISIISHELRTPMTVIQGALLMAIDGADRISAEKREDLLHRARQQSERVLHLTNKLLDHQRATLDSMLQSSPPAPQGTFKAMVLNLVSVVRIACDALGLLAQEAGAEIRVETDVAEALCAADTEAVERIVLNVVGNAIKYGPEGATVGVHLHAAGEMWRVEVGDRGPGVPDALKERIFEPFVRQETLRPNLPSAGLGLAIASSLVHQHDGNLGVRDREGGGSVFHFELPRFVEPQAGEGERTLVEGVGLADDLAADLELLLNRGAMELRRHRDAEAFLAGERADADAVVIDLASLETSEHLFSLLKELESRGLRRACVVPPPGGTGGEEAGRLFSFVQVLARRPTATELAASLAARA